MGLVASQARLLMLYATKSDLEYEVQKICQYRLDLASQTSILAQYQSNARQALSDQQSVLLSQLAKSYNDPNADNTDAENKRKALDTLIKQQQADFDSMNSQIQPILDKLQTIDKQKEMEQKTKETQRDAKQTEIQSVEKVIQKSIESGFKPFMS